MNFLYYFNRSKDRVNAINLDTIRIVECRKIQYDIMECNPNYIGFGLYIDNTLVHHFLLENVYRIYKKLLIDDEKAREVFDMYCKQFIKNEDEWKLINMAGFEKFNQYLKKKWVNIDELFRNYQLVGLQDYIEIFEENRRFDKIELITYYLITLRIFTYYTTMLRMSD